MRPYYFLLHIRPLFPSRSPFQPTDHTISQVLPLIYFGGYALLPRQLRTERDAAYAPLHAADSVDSQQNTRLLADEES